MDRRSILISIGVLTSTLGSALVAQSLIQQSRANCVLIESPAAKSHGTGFFLDEQHVATCFHVVASYLQGAGSRIHQDLRVIVPSGDTIQAVCISPPTDMDMTPRVYDFAVLKLNSRYHLTSQLNPLAKNDPISQVGSEVVFSGYPLESPIMLTHKGLVSGLAHGDIMICIQSSINRGNSGGALLNMSGEVIGIITLREARPTRDLARIRSKVETLLDPASKDTTSIELLTNIKNVANELDNYITTGIGYAFNIKFLKQYLARHPLN